MTGEHPQADLKQESVEEEEKTPEEKIEYLEHALSEQARIAEERLERLRYLQADFDNYRKKFDREKEMIIALADERLITELLVVVDDLERILTASTDTVQKEGIELLYRNLTRMLESHGLRRIASVGKKFDPFYHEAYCVEACDCESGTVLQEFQSGYILKTKVIRPAKVKVATSKNHDKGEN